MGIILYILRIYNTDILKMMLKTKDFYKLSKNSEFFILAYFHNLNSIFFDKHVEEKIISTQTTGQKPKLPEN